MEYLKYPKLEVRPLWGCGFWNGVTDGILEYEGQRYWFQDCDVYNNHPEMIAKWEEEDEEGWCRRYTIHELTSEELAEEEEVHKLFRTYVGTHTDLNEDWTSAGTSHHNTNKQEFYDKYKDKKPRDYRNNKIIGWCEK